MSFSRANITMASACGPLKPLRTRSRAVPTKMAKATSCAKSPKRLIVTDSNLASIFHPGTAIKRAMARRSTSTFIAANCANSSPATDPSSKSGTMARMAVTVSTAARARNAPSTSCTTINGHAPGVSNENSSPEPLSSAMSVRMCAGLATRTALPAKPAGPLTHPIRRTAVPARQAMS